MTKEDSIENIEEQIDEEKSMVSINEIININKIHNFKQLYKKCNEKESGFLVYNADSEDDKNYYSEWDRELVNIYDKTRVIIECKKKSCFIAHCVFEGDVRIILDECNTRLDIDNCIFRKSVSIENKTRKGIESFVNIMGCRINELFVKQRIDGFKLAYSYINSLVIQETLGQVLISNNIIYQFNPFKKVSDKDDIILHKNIIKDRNPISKRAFESKMFSKWMKKVERLDKVNKNISRAQFYETMIKSSDAKFNRNKYADYMYKKRLASTSNRLSKLFIHLTRGFCKPGVFIIYLLITFWGSALAYKELGNAIESGAVSYIDALYYSGLTITTLGYGDTLGTITELTDIIKMISIAESFIGLLLATCLLTAVFNKYSN